MGISVRVLRDRMGFIKTDSKRQGRPELRKQPGYMVIVGELDRNSRIVKQADKEILLQFYFASKSGMIARGMITSLIKLITDS
jgi:hypothetical protein